MSKDTKWWVQLACSQGCQSSLLWLQIMQCFSTMRNLGRIRDGPIIMLMAGGGGRIALGTICCWPLSCTKSILKLSECWQIILSGFAGKMEVFFKRMLSVHSGMLHEAPGNKGEWGNGDGCGGGGSNTQARDTTEIIKNPNEKVKI